MDSMVNVASPAKATSSAVSASKTFPETPSRMPAYASTRGLRPRKRGAPRRPRVGPKLGPASLTGRKSAETMRSCKMSWLRFSAGIGAAAVLAAILLLLPARSAYAAEPADSTIAVLGLEALDGAPDAIASD